MDENIITKISIDGLTTDKVSVSRQRHIKLGEYKYSIEMPCRTAFENSIKGREELMSQIEEPYLSAILAVWGTEPTIQIQQIKNRGED